MPKRVAVVLSGCGHQDGSEIREAVLAMLAIERAGGEPVCVAPDVLAPVIDHRTGERSPDGAPRSVLAESARIARGAIRDIATVKGRDVDAIVVPGGFGAGTVLSNYVEKGVLCDVHPEVARLLREGLTSRRPMGFICLAPILAARVLGPVAGVRVTLGARGTPPDKHAAVMGADVRPCPVKEIIIDQKHRIVSTPAYMYDDARLSDVASSIEKLVRTVLQFTREARCRCRKNRPHARTLDPPRRARPRRRGRKGC
jgi:enhancing lycopene biosynthesis protein 2